METPTRISYAKDFGGPEEPSANHKQDIIPIHHVDGKRSQGSISPEEGSHGPSDSLLANLVAFEDECPQTGMLAETLPQCLGTRVPYLVVLHVQVCEGGIAAQPLRKRLGPGVPDGVFEEIQ